MTTGTDDTAQGPSAEDIQAALNKTGFLLEHRVAKSLRGYQLLPEVTVEVTLGDAYPDPESGKSREIDVYADFYEFVEREPDISVQVSIALLVECKNSSGPFVLIGDHGQETPSTHDWALTSFDPFSLDFENAGFQSLEQRLKLQQLPGLPTRHDFVGRQLLRLNRQGGIWKAENNSIYDSILYPLVKAWQYKVGELEREKEQFPDDSWQTPGIKFTFPVIVTSSQLYIVDATNDDLQIRQAKWASIRRTFSSKEIKGAFWADVVPFANWIEYLDAKVAKVFASARDAVTKNIHFYDPEWMISHFGQPADEEFLNEWLDYHKDQRGDGKDSPGSKA